MTNNKYNVVGVKKHYGSDDIYDVIKRPLSKPVELRQIKQREFLPTLTQINDLCHKEKQALNF